MTIVEHESLFGNREKSNHIKLATIASDYVSGKPRLVFDGETTASLKAYPYLASYTPAAGDRVLMVKGVLIGKIIV